MSKRRQRSSSSSTKTETSAQLNQRISELEQLVKAQNWPAATTAAEQLFEAAPLQPGVLERAIGVLRQGEAWPQLTTLLLEARNRYRLWPQGSNLLVGQGLVEQGQHGQAIAYLEAALDEPDSEGWAHHFVGKALRQSGELEAALDHQRQASDLLADFAWAPFDAAELLLELGRAHEAVLEAQEARRRLGAASNPVVEQLWQRLQPAVLEQQIDSHVARGEHGKALELLRRALAQAPDNTSLRQRVVELVLPTQSNPGESVSALERELLSIELLLDVLEGKA